MFNVFYLLVISISIWKRIICHFVYLNGPSDRHVTPKRRRHTKNDIFFSLVSSFAFITGKMKFMELFGRLKSVVIGMIHVKALPGKRILHRPLSFTGLMQEVRFRSRSKSIQTFNVVKTCLALYDMLI